VYNPVKRVGGEGTGGKTATPPHNEMLRRERVGSGQAETKEASVVTGAMQTGVW